MTEKFNGHINAAMLFLDRAIEVSSEDGKEYINAARNNLNSFIGSYTPLKDDDYQQLKTERDELSQLLSIIKEYLDDGFDSDELEYNLQHVNCVHSLVSGRTVKKSLFELRADSIKDAAKATRRNTMGTWECSYHDLIKHADNLLNQSEES